MLKTRIVTGAILSGVIAAVILLSHIPWVMNTANAIVSMQAIYERYSAVGHKRIRCDTL